MLVTRTPMRISIGGGGTDLPSYYRDRGGFLVAGAIDKHCYIALNRTFTDDYLLKYSMIERVAAISDIQHPLIREAFEMHDVEPAIEMVSVADIPSGTGLGSSGTFTVGLLRAIHALQRSPVQTAELAEEACAIEIDRLSEPVGKQDQYIAAFGGLTIFEFNRDDTVQVRKLAISPEDMLDLESRLLLFFTGYSRRAAAILEDQKSKSEAGDVEMFASLDRAKDIGLQIVDALEEGDLHRYGKLMDSHWRSKRERTPGMSNADIDRWYDLALANGAVGGKIVGAGAGGFLLLLVEDASAVRRVMATEGLKEMPFRFDLDGSTVLARS